MTPEIRFALGQLIGRALTDADVAAIAPHLAVRNDVAIAAILSAGRTKPTVREIGNGTVLEVLGIEVGNVLLDELSNNPVYRHVKPLLDQGRLRIDSALVQATLQGFAAGQAPILTQAQADAMCALGKIADPIHFNAVSDALNIAEGRLVL